MGNLAKITNNCLIPLAGKNLFDKECYIVMIFKSLLVTATLISFIKVKLFY